MKFMKKIIFFRKYIEENQECDIIITDVSVYLQINENNII